MPKILYSILLLLLFTACSEPVFVKQELPLNTGSWPYNEVLESNFTIEDINKKYNLFLDIEHEKDYPFQNIYCKIITQFPDGKKTEQILPINFADNKGIWYGKCGKQCKLRVVLQEQVSFKLMGDYKIIIEQYSRKNDLEGIHSLSFIIS